jgi:hypothetical protein
MAQADANASAMTAPGGTQLQRHPDQGRENKIGEQGQCQGQVDEHSEALGANSPQQDNGLSDPAPWECHAAAAAPHEEERSGVSLKS